MNEQNHAYEQAAAQMRGVIEMVAALDCDYDRLQELREEVKPYRAGWNMPGYMPDSEPADFEDANGAREYIAEQMREQAESHENEADAISDDDAMTGEGLRARQEYRALAAELHEAADALESLSADKASAEYGRTVAGLHYWIAYDPSATAGLDESDAEELRGLIDAAGDCEDEDEARERILEDALCVDVRTGWHTPSDESKPDEFRIVLCTGGPHVQIRGELNEHGEPSRAWLEYQDWFTGMSEYHGEDFSADSLLRYASCFYFGE